MVAQEAENELGTRPISAPSSAKTPPGTAFRTSQISAPSWAPIEHISLL